MPDDAEEAVDDVSTDEQELEFAACRQHFPYFVERTFKIVNPSTPYIHSWHIDALGEYLMACHRREIKRLIINIPPRSLKSGCVTIAWPAWLLGNDPACRIMAASYSMDLSLKHSMDCRAIIENEWFKSCFPNSRLGKDQNEKGSYTTTKMGHRFSTSVGSTTTGRGGSIILCDDPHEAMQAQSDTIRNSQIEWFDRAYSTRMDDKETGVMVVVMQRLHQNDLTGHLLKKGGWEHLCLPAVFEKQRTISIGRFKKEIIVGEYLQPIREGKKVLEHLRKELGSYAFAGQFMQNPVPEGGGIIKQKWLNIWPWSKPLPKFHYIMQVWDTAFTEKTTGDPSACGTFGVFFPDDEVKDEIRQIGGFAVMLIDYFSDHLGFPELRKKMIEMRAFRYGRQEKAVDSIVIEAKASGLSAIQELKRANLPIISYNPGRLDKMARLHGVSHFIENGLLWIPESSRNEGQITSWAMDYVNELTSFPAAEHDEAVDITSSSLKLLSDMTFMRMEEMAKDIDEDNADPYAGANRVNPYSQ